MSNLKVNEITGKLPIKLDNLTIETGKTIGKMRIPTVCEVGITTMLPIEGKMIKVNENISENDVKELVNLINEYRNCFALNINELGCTDVIHATIRDNGNPVVVKPYKTNSTDRKTINEMVNEWKRIGIVTETQSPYSSPVLLVKKKTNEKRLVVDYRRLNSQTIGMRYPMPNIDECFDCLAGNKLFTCLDLSNGYLQIPIDDPESREKTAFITEDQTGEFTKLMFGLKNAPFIFTNSMGIVMRDLKTKQVATYYLDDVLIPAKTWEEMLIKIRMVFDAFQKAKLTMKISKCEFAKDHIDFLGFVISAKGILPGTKKIEAIAKYVEPRTVHEVRQYLGLTGFFRRFIANYAQIARPISDLTRGGVSFKWGSAQQRAFEDLREKLINGPVLQLYNPKAETELHTDASSMGFGGLLLQKDNNELMRLVYCVSKKTTEEEAKYHSSKLELFAILWCVERLRSMLIGIKFKIITDCQALMAINVVKTKNSQIARWITTLAEYDFLIVHRSGKYMEHVDALSRNPVEECKDTMEDIEARLNVFTLVKEKDYIDLLQRNDELLCVKIDILRKSEEERTIQEKNLVNGYEFKKGHLCKKVRINNEYNYKYVIPNTMRKTMVVKMHDLMGHGGLERTCQRILKHYWFKNMRRYVRKHIRGCVECLFVAVPAGKQPGYLHPLPITARPFSRIHLDHTGPFVSSVCGNSYILVIIDSFTRYVRLYAVTGTKVDNNLPKVQEFVCDYGLPDKIVTDRGTCFTSTIFENLRR